MSEEVIPCFCGGGVFLRVLGAFAVMMLHIAGGNWRKAEIFSLSWQAMNFWDSITRWAVPVFVMMSGSLFLSKDIPFRKLFTKYIFRIITALVFWSFVYAAKDYVKTGDAVKAAANFIRGHYHLWFLYMIIGLYAVVPFMKKIAESAFLTRYFLALALVFTFLLPHGVKILAGVFPKHGAFAAKFLDSFYMNLPAGYTGYFLLGFVLSKIHLSAKLERLIYALGLASAAATIVLTFIASAVKGTPTEIFYKYLTVNVLGMAAAIFVFFRQHFNRESKFIRRLSQYSFGAYLVHDAVIQLCRKLGLHSMAFAPAFAIPVAAVVVFVVSFAISALLNNIPAARKYIV